ncbi:MAG TPA: hypothetical protein VNI52_10525 [Sphingobacteriaceae bacterium]|nr:hypothetical protein [Sphingobacteriaceae bacterium]
MYKSSIFSISLFFLIGVFYMQVLAQPGSGKKPVRIIYDTDMDLDVDDVGALAVLHALADNGEAEILGIVINAPTPYAATTAVAINKYYGRPNILVGDMPIDEYVYDRSFDKWYRNYSISTPYGNFNVPLFKRFDHGITSRNQVWNGVQLYRKLLAEAPDKSVTIAAVGLLTVLEDLMYSKPDKYSKLSGKELIKLKVKELVCMAGGNQPGPGRVSFNWGFEGRGDAQRISREWPTPLYLSPTGSRVGTGARLSTETPENNPVRVAYELFLRPANHKNRPTWDEIAVYYAVRGAGNIFSEPVGRRLDVTAESVNNEWRDAKYVWRDARPGEPLHIRIEQKIGDEELGKIIEDLMVQLPKSNKEASMFKAKSPSEPGYKAFSMKGIKPRIFTVAMNEEPIHYEDLFFMTDQETIKWNAPGGKGPEVIVINPKQNFSEEYTAITQSGKSAIVLVHDQHKEAFIRVRENSKKSSGSLVFVLTKQTDAPWYSINMEI